MLTTARSCRLIALTLAALTLLSPNARAQFGDGDEVTLRVIPQSETVAPGGQALIAVVLDHKPGWHSHVNEPQIPEGWGDFGEYVIPTVVGVMPTDGVRAGPTQYPEPHTVMVDFLYSGTPDPYKVYDGRAVMYVPLLIDEGATGELVVPLSIQYQVCDDKQCLAPEDVTREVTLRVVDATVAGADAPGHGDLFAAFDASVFSRIASGEVDGQAPVAESKPAEARTFFGIPLPSEDSPVRLLVLALLAAAGGFILNLTPCVLPVLPIKVMTISHHAGSKGKSLYLGLWMAAGVVAFWLALGLPVAFLTSVTDPSMLFGIWWVTLGIGIIIAVMGLGIMGLFAIKLPDKVQMANPKADNAPGSFMFGVMTAVLGLPCFGFVAGALLAGAATMPAIQILTIFASLGAGMALPYLVLSVKPSWVDVMPRTGPASELIKQIMGLLLLAAAAYFAGSGVIGFLSERNPTVPWWVKSIHWWAIGLFVGAAGLWLVVRTFQITPSLGRRVVFALIGLIAAGGTIAYAADTTAKARDNFWVGFEQATLDRALAGGDVVVVDFTAEWCLNCKALKAAVLMREPVKSRLLESGVTPLVADLTSVKAPGWDKLRELGQTGIPLLVVYGPGLDQPWLANNYTPQQVLEAMDRAAGAETAAR